MPFHLVPERNHVIVMPCVAHVLFHVYFTISVVVTKTHLSNDQLVIGLVIREQNRLHRFQILSCDEAIVVQTIIVGHNLIVHILKELIPNFGVGHRILSQVKRFVNGSRELKDLLQSQLFIHVEVKSDEGFHQVLIRKVVLTL